MIRDILTFVYKKIIGEFYVCDRCQDLGHNYMTIGLIEYIKNKNKRGRYCRTCWNWIHLKHGTCDCGTYVTMRSKWGENVKSCPKCFNIIKLEINL